MTEADTPGSPADRDAVIDRYSGLARRALAGDTIADCDPAAFADGCFGAAAYPSGAEVPEAALLGFALREVRRFDEAITGWQNAAARAAQRP